MSAPGFHMLRTFVLVLAALAAPAGAQTPADLVAEAITVADQGSVSSPNGLRAIIETRARLGDTEGAIQMIVRAEEMWKAQFWGALVDGVIAGAGPAAAAPFAARVPDPVARELALSAVLRAQRALPDLDGMQATLALMTPGAHEQKGRAALLGAMLDAGDEAGALDLLPAMAHPEGRNQALLELVAFLVAEGRVDAALRRLPDFTPDWQRESARMHILTALARAGRQPEAEAMLSMLDDPYSRFQAQTELAVVAAEAGDIEAARDWIARIPDEVSRSGALARVLEALLLAGATPAARDLLASDLAPPAGRDPMLRVLLTALVRQDRIDLATPLLDQMQDAASRDFVQAAIVRRLAASDPAAARARLDDMTSAPAIFNAVLAVIDRQPDPALTERALAIARSEPDPVRRIEMLCRLALHLAGRL